MVSSYWIPTWGHLRSPGCRWSLETSENEVGTQREHTNDLRVRCRGGCGWSTWTPSARSPTRCCSAGRSWRQGVRSASSRSAPATALFTCTRFYVTARLLITACRVLFEQDGPAFRYTTSEVTVQPSPCLSYRIPRDFVDLSSGEDAYKLIDFLKLVRSWMFTYGCGAKYFVFSG